MGFSAVPPDNGNSGTIDSLLSSAERTQNLAHERGYLEQLQNKRMEMDYDQLERFNNLVAQFRNDYRNLLADRGWNPPRVD